MKELSLYFLEKGRLKWTAQLMVSNIGIRVVLCQNLLASAVDIAQQKKIRKQKKGKE